MDKYKIHTILIAIMIVATCTALLSFAEDKPGYKVLNTKLITNDREATYIEGEVDAAIGQEIILKNGLTTIASKTLPSTGRKAEFRIKVPEKSIKKTRLNVYYLKSENPEDAKDIKEINERVEVLYQERQSQVINVQKQSYAMTFPGFDDKLVAKASSGDDLIYVSKNPEVAQVKADGTLVPIGQGETEISVQQIGNGKFEKAEKTVKVSVEAIDAYTVTFHSSAEDEQETQQIVYADKEEPLQDNVFVNGDHRFLGWATEDGGIVKYKDAEAVTNLCEKGGNQDLYAVWTGDGAAAALAWAIEIAADDSFAYGAKPAANAIGCHFCGTNCGPVKHNKPRGYEKTYVCLTFVGAAYAHGAEDPEILWADQHAKMPLYLNDNNFSRFSCWTKVGSCSSLSTSDLKPGDVVIQWSDTNDNDGHAWMYAGEDLIVESTGGGWGANSIALKSGAASRLASYGRSGRNYVMRYTGANAQ